MMSRRFLLATVAFALASGAVAAPKDDLHAAFAKFLAQSSFKATTTSTVGGRVQHATVEFQAPDRYRIIPVGRPPSVIIGDMVYVVVNGMAMKMPIPGRQMIGQYRDPGIVARIEDSLSVEDLGTESIGGKPSHKYRLAAADQQTTTVAWVSKASGLPIQLQVSDKARGRDVETTIGYSAFSDPSIQVEAPTPLRRP